MADGPSLDDYAQAVFDSVPNGVAMIDPQGSIRLVNDHLVELFGLAREELVGRAAMSLILPAEHPEFARLQIEASEARPATREFSALAEDGSEFPVEVALSPFRAGEPGTLMMIVSDVSERKRSDEHQHLLIGELHHRTQNLFAVIQSVANRSLTGHRTLDEARQVFLQRLHALSRTYTTLTEGAWKGAQLEKILRDELAPFSARVDLGGDPVWIQPSAAQTFALIFHELATNATKHGALSIRGGNVVARWTVTGEPAQALFSFTWRETNGPKLEKPSRKGYGQTILEDGAKHIGTPRITYAPEGLQYDLTAPLAAIGWSVAAPTRRMFWQTRH